MTATGPLVELNLRYRGKFYDTATGFYWLETRYYNPQWRRFINADVLFIAGCVLTAANMFAYCNNNPVMFVDPDGMAAQAGARLIAQGIALAMYVALAVQVMVGLGASVAQAGDVLIRMSEAAGNVTQFIRSAGNLIDMLTTNGRPFLFAGGTPTWGEPWSSDWVSKNVLRFFGGDGRALWDLDFGKNHPELGPGPHIHDWDWNNPRPHGDAQPFDGIRRWWDEFRFRNSPGPVVPAPNTGDFWMRIFVR